MRLFVHYARLYHNIIMSTSLGPSLSLVSSGLSMGPIRSVAPLSCTTNRENSDS